MTGQSPHPHPAVTVDADDLRTVLNQRNRHHHQRPGVWDDDNRPGVAGTPCPECRARGRLEAALAALGAIPDQAGRTSPP